MLSQLDSVGLTNLIANRFSFVTKNYWRGPAPTVNRRDMRLFACPLHKRRLYPNFQDILRCYDCAFIDNAAGAYASAAPSNSQNAL
jgi:hypothetical protein